MTLLVWLAAVMMLLGAGMLVAGSGAPGLWIAVVTVGIAIVAIDLAGRRRGIHP